MAFLDNALIFSSAQALTTTAVSTNIYDVTSAGSGVTPTMTGTNGLNTNLGFDIGTGDGIRPEVQVFVTAAGTGATGNGINILLQAAPDNGSYAPGTWQTIYESQFFTGVSMTTGYTITFPVPEIAPDMPLPRFYRLDYLGSGTFTVSLNANLLINPGSTRVAQLYGKNFSA